MTDILEVLICLDANVSPFRCDVNLLTYSASAFSLKTIKAFQALPISSSLSSSHLPPLPIYSEALA